MAETPAYELTSHAITVVRERGIKKEWIDQVLSDPNKTEPDRIDPQLRHALLPIAEHGNRVLRVIYNQSANPWRIVSVYFDRTKRGRI